MNTCTMKEKLEIVKEYSSSVGGRHGGLMVSALDSRSSGPGSRTGRDHCDVFLGKTLDSHSASLYPSV